jgi:hypothetical protein
MDSTTALLSMQREYGARPFSRDLGSTSEKNPRLGKVTDIQDQSEKLFHYRELSPLPTTFAYVLIRALTIGGKIHLYKVVEVMTHQTGLFLQSALSFTYTRNHLYFH